ncbi:hypothetical protein Tco_0041008 [Tanacetum coccineum]
MDDNMMEAANSNHLWLKPEHCNYREHLFREPGKTTRTGDGYQAQIPTSLIGVMQYRANTQEYVRNESDMLTSGSDSDQLSVVLNVLNGQSHEDALDKKNKLAKSDESGSVLDHANFRLGFYLFGKKLCLVNKFTGTEETGKLLGYYYGNFYITNEHKQWSIYRKKKNKKEKPGMKIFKDWRRDELFSRIFPSISDECRASLTRATRMFQHKETSFETYVFSVKSIVGINLLVKAVGLGIKNRDLTSITKKRSTNKNLNPPLFSSLMTKEVVDLLKYGITLSKERLRDLFEEAVWPRLKAKGWRCEKPYFSRKNHLVFLAPGVKKYTRRAQTKGSDYFDSYVDVMLKVALTPQLLEPNLCQGMLVHQHVKQGLDSSVSLKGESSKACERDAHENLRTCLLTAEQLEARVSGSQNRTKKMKITQENSPLDILAEAALADWRLMYAKSE